MAIGKKLGTHVLGLAVAAALPGCGGSEEPNQATGRSMMASAEESAAAAAPKMTNTAPVIESVVIDPSNPMPGEQVRAHVTASDPDGDRVELHYDWRVDGRPVGDKSVLPVGNYGRGSQIELRVTANDGEEDSPENVSTVRVGNQAPVLMGVVIEPLGVVTANHDVLANPKANDLDGDEIEYEFTWWINGDTADTDGAVLSHELFERGDTIELSVVASDGSDESEPLRSKAIKVENSAPEITSVPGGFDAEGTFTYQVKVSDADEDRRFRYRLVESPPAMRIDFVSGVITWTPAEGDAGEHPVTIEVDDMAGGKDTQSFPIAVRFEPLEQKAQPPAAPAETES